MLNSVYTMTFKDALDFDPTLLDGITWDTQEHTNKLKEMIRAKYYNYEISGETFQEQRLFLTNKFIQYRDYYAEMLMAYETSIAWLDGEIETINGTDTTTYGKKTNNTGTEAMGYGHTITESGNDTTTETRDTTDTTKRGIETKTETENWEEVTRTLIDLPRSSASEQRPTRIEKTKPDGAKNVSTNLIIDKDAEDTLERDGTNEFETEYGHIDTHGGTDTKTLNTQTALSGSDANSKNMTRKTVDLITQKERYLKLIRNLYSEFADKFQPCFITMFS